MAEQITGIGGRFNCIILFIIIVIIIVIYYLMTVTVAPVQQTDVM